MRPAALPALPLFLALFLALPLLLAGCRSDEPEMTPQALAWLVAEHVGTPETARASDDVWQERFDGDTVGVDLRFGIGDEGRYDPGDSVSLIVGTGFDSPGWTSCADIGWQNCEDLDGGGTILWELLDPEEDPGYIKVFRPQGDDTTVIATYGSDAHITSDPRTMDLPVGVDDLVALAEDPRVAMTTDQEAIDEGADLPYWKGSP